MRVTARSPATAMNVALAEIASAWTNATATMKSAALSTMSRRPEPSTPSMISRMPCG